METYATYSPEDNKLRLYIGRVPRPEYEKLRAEGWKALHKQREAGGGDFAAVWTPARRDTALKYSEAGILDEDMGPEERAADRAERFSGYRDKRTEEATGRADQYEAGPSAHGYQSAARAEKAAARHDRIGTHAVDAWSKAEYWQRRTAGVIRHALYLSSPGVRMGRIKTIEADLRRSHLCPEWRAHLELRLAYENQMLAAQGGRLEQCEVLAGGKLGGRLILKVNKSTATGRATSCSVLGPKVDGWAYQVTNIPHTDFAEYYIELERISPGSYIAPTPETLAELKAFKASVKAAAPKVERIPLVNPTDADAERLQQIWNDKVKARWEAKRAQDKYSYVPEFKPQAVCRITQATYSAHSKGAYSSASIKELCHGGEIRKSFRSLYGKEYEAARNAQGAPVCEIRQTSGENYMAERVIILTDKPQKPLPAAVWEPYTPPALETAAPSENVLCSACGRTTPRNKWEMFAGHLIFGSAMVCPHCQMQHAATNKAETALLLTV